MCYQNLLVIGLRTISYLARQFYFQIGRSYQQFEIRAVIVSEVDLSGGSSRHTPVMPRNNFMCCHEVKRGFMHIHSKCDKARSPDIKTGAFLNQYLECPNVFNPRTRYQVCYNLMRQLQKKPTFEKLREKKIVLPPVVTTREERVLKRHSEVIEPVTIDNPGLMTEQSKKKLNS